MAKRAGSHQLGLLTETQAYTKKSQDLYFRKEKMMKKTYIASGNIS
jgi:hypothetical protein